MSVTLEPAVLGIRDLLASFRSALVAADVAALFKMSVPTVYRQAQKGLIPSLRSGSLVRFDPKKLSEWYEDQRADSRS